MTERRFREIHRLFRAPLPPICNYRTLPRSYRWAGVHINRPIPTEGHRVSALTREDEEAGRNFLRTDEWDADAF